MRHRRLHVHHGWKHQLLIQLDQHTGFCRFIIVYQTARIGVRPSVHGGEGYQPEGEINGVPTQAGAFKFTVTANDAKGCIGSRDYKLTIGDVKAKG